MSTTEAVSLNDSLSTTIFKNDTNRNSGSFDRSYIKTVEFVCQGVLVPLVGSLGVVGNILILMVLTRSTIVCPTNYFLAALAVSDIAYLVVQIPMQQFVHGTASSQSYSWFGAYYWIAWYVVVHMFFTSTCWLTTAVVTERFLSLRFSTMRLSMKRIKMVVFAIFIASILINLSKCFEFEPSVNISDPRPARNTKLMKTQAYTTARSVLHCTLVILLPVVLMVVFNAFLLRFLFTHRRRMSVHGPATASGFNLDVQHVGVSVFTVVLIFVVCYLPEVYNSLNLAVHGGMKAYSVTANVVIAYVSRVLGTVNSSVNFVVYMITNRRFRKKFIVTFAKYSACRRLGNAFTDRFSRGSFRSSGRQTSCDTAGKNGGTTLPVLVATSTTTVGPGARNEDGESARNDGDDEIK